MPTVENGKNQLKFHVIACAFIACLSVALYANTYNYEFVWIDGELIQDAKEIRPPVNLKVIFTTAQQHVYRPVRTLYYAALYALGPRGSAPDPAVYHGANILVNAMFCVLLYFICLGVFGDRWKSLAVAALFAAHPIHSEPVAFVTANADMLAGLLLAASLLCLRMRNGEKNGALYVPGLILFAAALFAKEVAVVFPVMVLADDVLVRRERLRAKLISSRLPLFLLSLLYICIRFFLIGETEQARLIYGWSPSVVVPSVIKLIPHYLGQLTYPASLCPDDMSYKIALSFREPVVWGTVIGCLLATAAFVRVRRTRRPAVYGAFWFAATLMPVMQIVPLGTFCADRYMYLPSAGFCIACVALAAWAIEAMKINERACRIILIAIAAAVAIFWGMRTPAQNRIWKDNLTLYTNMTQCAPKSFKAENDLSKTLVKLERYDEALVHSKRAFELNPSDGNLAMNLGNMYARLGSYGEGRAAFIDAYSIDASNTSALLRAGFLSEKMKDYESAARIYGLYMQIDPNDTTIRARVDEVRKKAALGYRP